jgi:5-methylcytosine-specific restriction endonuclease McrA
MRRIIALVCGFVPKEKCGSRSCSRSDLLLAVSDVLEDRLRPGTRRGNAAGYARPVRTRFRIAIREHSEEPPVRVVRRFKRERIRIRFSRLNIYARDGFTCQYCAVAFATEDLTFDHVLPGRAGRTSSRAASLATPPRPLARPTRPT